ncbi:hypothetical protein ABIA33_004209 [Streptacidiphilus sp. MAP12-16]|uniref:hypothetical protein n=1 Tax=Streptacidiphilus sp. MAP12-16 TaxID=3156300 RepID=UPI003511CB60
MKLKRIVAAAVVVPLAAGATISMAGSSASAATLPKTAPASATLLAHGAQPQFLGDWAKKAAAVAGGAFVAGFTAKAGAAAWEAATTVAAASSSSSSESSSSSSGVPITNGALAPRTTNADTQFDAAH